jgi:hypothetical protein
MGSKITFGRVVGLIFVLAALVSGTASASNDRPAASFYTPLALQAEGLRLQGMAQVYERMQGLKADGLRLKGIAQVYQGMQDRPAASFYTPQALKAQGLRWEGIAEAYGAHKTASAPTSSSSSSGFDWSAAFIGAASMLGLAMAGAALLVGARRVRRTKVAV